MSVFYDLSKTPRNILNQAIVRAIVSENNGAWFDPSDLSTLYQDAAGTVPVTAVEQPVGKILDKSGNGNHATQSVTASQPTLSARKNALLAAEALATQSVTSIAAQYTLSFTGTGSVTLSGTATGTLTGTGVNDRVSLTVTPTAGTLTLKVSGSVTKAQLELGTSAGPYQRVNTSTDYDTDPRYFPKYLRFDGVDDYLNLPYMGLYANGSASVVAGVYLQPKATTQYIIGETTSTASSSRYAPLVIFITPTLLITLIRNDSNVELINSTNISTALPPPPSVTSVVDTGNSVSMRTNSVLVSTANYSRASTLTANITSIGALAQSTAVFFAQMNLYSLIITKSALTDAQRIKCERYAASKSGVIL